MLSKVGNYKSLLLVTSLAIYLLLVYQVDSFNSNALRSQQYSRNVHTKLFVATSSSSKTKVVFQKVVRPAPKQNIALFLPQLIEYIQDKFHLPSNLPMVYETTKETTKSNTVISWDSPLSTSTDTLLMIEVMAIQVGNDHTKYPEMAMVAVHKNIASSTESPLITSNLFADSEKKILKSLDRGLDKFSSGKIAGFKTNDMSSSQTWEKISRDDVDDEFDLSEPLTYDSNIIDVIPEESKNSPVIDEIPGSEEFAIEAAKVAAEKLQKEKESMEKYEEELQRSKEDDEKNAIPENDSMAADKEYAIKAAKEAIQQKVSENIDGEYALGALKNVMKLKGIKKRERPKKEDLYVDEEEEKQEARPKMNSNAPMEGSQVSMDPSMEPQPPKMNGPSWSISSPKRRAKSNNHEPKFYPSESDSIKAKTKNKIKKKFDISKDLTVDVQGLQSTLRSDGSSKDPDKKASTSSEIIQDVKLPDSAIGKNSKSRPIVEAEIVQKSDTNDIPSESNKKDISKLKRNLNIKTVNKKEDHLVSNMHKIDIQEKEGDSKDVKITKEAQRMMEEIAAQSEDMTSEELLESILKFGEETKKEEAVGGGFVSGAFEKAKELLREQKKKREARLKEASKVNFNLDIADSSESKNKETVSPEEELRRIFQAGEQFADKQIERHATETKLTKEQDAVVDELVRGEKEISSHARTLDEELAELEVRINRNPAEDIDGPARNAMFDVMSGPEVYNPNVDPETAVNWPGALPGTKAVRLPKELDEAVKQAKFAAGVLTKMREEATVGLEKGQNMTEYYVGDKKFTHQEVKNLCVVVEEAVNLGIINDPLLLMEERSRLQIVLDELWDQPEERFREIVDCYRDLLLSENFVGLLKERLTAMADRDLNAMRNGNEDEQRKLKHKHDREREFLGKLIVHAQLLLKEVAALGAQLEAQQVEVIRSICKVAMDPLYKTEEETAAALTDVVRDMRPMFDETFVAYMKYAVAEEEARLARAGLLDDPDHCQWFMVLKIIQQGVYTEIAKGINRLLEHIWYVMRMETPEQRRALLKEIVDDLPTLDVRPFVQVVDNIAASLGDAVKGDIDPTALGEMTNKLLQLHRDTHNMLPESRIDEMAKDADEWAAKQKQRLLEQRAIAKKRIEDNDRYVTDDMLRRAADVERFD